MSTRPVLLILLAAFAGCAPAATMGGTHDRNHVGHEELTATHAPDLYSALKQTRPEFFASRGVSSIRLGSEDIPAVFIDGVAVGDIQDRASQEEALRNVAVMNVIEVRRLTPSESTIRLGRDSPAGALLVTTSRAPSGNPRT